jgi:hypothetical protein
VAQVDVSSVARVASGGAVTLNAVLRDESGNVTHAPARVKFFDSQGDLLGSASADRGVATFQYVPVPSVPEIESIESVTLTLENGAELPGVAIVGRGFSNEAEVLLDGKHLDANDGDYAVVASRRILVAVDPQMSTEFLVRNPGGQEAAMTFAP